MSENVVRYEVSVPRPEHHLALVTASVGALSDRESLVVVLPTWAPGSYKIRDFAKQVQDVRAKDEQGRPLECVKIRKNAWSIARKGAKRIDVSLWCARWLAHSERRNLTVSMRSR